MRRIPFTLLTCDHCKGRYTDVGPRHLCPDWAEQVVARFGPRTPVPVEPVESETQHSAPERQDEPPARSQPAMRERIDL